MEHPKEDHVQDRDELVEEICTALRTFNKKQLLEIATRLAPFASTSLLAKGVSQLIFEEFDEDKENS